MQSPVPPARPEPANAGAETVDYGRQIDFGEDGPVIREPATAPAPVARAAAPAPAAKPAAKAATPASRPAAEPAAKPAAPSSRPAAEPAPASRTSGAPSIRNAPPATAPAEGDASSASIVVPVTFPVGGTTGEIVIRIVLKPAA
jgi:hypothetical protein